MGASPPQPACEAGASASAQHGEGIEDGAVADKIEHSVELFGLGDALRKIRSLDLDARNAQLLQRGGAVLATCRGDDPNTGGDSHVDRGPAKRRAPAPDHQGLALDNLE